jgi:hypothetical protein
MGIRAGTMAPPSGNAGESKCAYANTNIDCNYIGIPWREATRSMGASAHSPVHCR